MNKQFIGPKGQQQLQEYFNKYFGKLCRVKVGNLSGLLPGTEVIPYGFPTINSWGSVGADNTTLFVAVSYCVNNSTSPSVSSIRITDFDLVEEDSSVEGTTKDELTKMKETLKQQLEVVEMKLKFIKESGAKEFNEKEFKAYQTLELVSKQSMSNFEKAYLIAKLF